MEREAFIHTNTHRERERDAMPSHDLLFLHPDTVAWETRGKEAGAGERPIESFFLM